MSGRYTTWLALGVLSLALSSPAFAANLPEKVDFNYHIKPLLSDRCYACHGPDEKARKAKLRLDQKDGAFKALEDGWSVIKPGNPSQSEVIRRITAKDPDDLMPPPKSNLALNADEIALIRRWVEQGAEWGKHWSFVPVPAVHTPKASIDHFVRTRLEREALKPAPEASKERLIRRVTFDLTGLPPTLDEIDAFLGPRIRRLARPKNRGEQRDLLHSGDAATRTLASAILNHDDAVMKR